MYFPMQTFCAPRAPPINGHPNLCSWGDSVSSPRATAIPMKTIQLSMIYAYEMGLSSSCGTGISASYSGVTDMASRHPTIVHAMADNSSVVGRSNKMTRVTKRLMIMDVDPKTPTVDGGSHVKAIKSSVEALAERNMAIINNGRQNTGHVRGMARFLFLVLGSW